MTKRVNNSQILEIVETFAPKRGSFIHDYISPPFGCEEWDKRTLRLFNVFKNCWLLLQPEDCSLAEYLGVSEEHLARMEQGDLTVFQEAHHKHWINFRTYTAKLEARCRSGR